MYFFFTNRKARTVANKADAAIATYSPTIKTERTKGASKEFLK